jgi:hypothetical protein
MLRTEPSDATMLRTPPNPPSPQPTEMINKIAACQKVLLRSSHNHSSDWRGVYELQNGGGQLIVADPSVVKNIDFSKPVMKKAGSPAHYLFFNRMFRKWVVSVGLTAGREQRGVALVLVGKSTSWYPWDCRSWYFHLFRETIPLSKKPHQHNHKWQPIQVQIDCYPLLPTAAPTTHPTEPTAKPTSAPNMRPTAMPTATCACSGMADASGEGSTCARTKVRRCESLSHDALPSTGISLRSLIASLCSRMSL